MVSVIIPTHNRASLVPRAIQSVLEQSYQDLQVIIVDDGSTDNTAGIVSQYHDPRVEYVRHEFSKGASAARNTGIQHAKGEAVAFLDDDDYWGRYKLEKQLTLLEKYDAVCTAVQFFGKNSMSGRVHSYPFERVRAKDLRRRNLGSASSFIAKREVFQRVRFDASIKYAEDLDVYISLFRQGFTIGYIDEPLTFMGIDSDRPRMTRQVKNASISDMGEWTKVCDKHRDFLGYWSANCRKAAWCLSFFSGRPNKIRLISYTIANAGLLPTVNVILRIIIKKITKLNKKALWDRMNYFDY